MCLLLGSKVKLFLCSELVAGGFGHLALCGEGSYYFRSLVTGVSASAMMNIKRK